MRDTSSLVQLARSEGADRVILGLARNMDGSEGPQADAAREMAAVLEEAGLSVELIDERLTTWEAGERLAGEGRRPKRATGELDSAAARLILQDYLDTRRNPERRIAPDTQEGR
jgi:putative Holliday junction resolvase